MKTGLKIVEIINGLALLFLLLGAYGLAITGALQVLAAAVFIALFPKNKFIYIYFALVAIFFLLWDGQRLNWLFAITAFLIIYLTAIIYHQKKKYHETK